MSKTVEMIIVLFLLAEIIKYCKHPKKFSGHPTERPRTEKAMRLSNWAKYWKNHERCIWLKEEA